VHYHNTHICNWSCHGFGDPPYGCKCNILKWSFGSRDLYKSIQGICIRSEGITCVQAITEDVVSPNQPVLYQ
jgi:hypothetical protein